MSRTTRRKYVVGAAIVGAMVAGAVIAPAAALTNGTAVPNDQTPSVVKVVTAYGTCTGAVVDLSWVATAASCFTPNPEDHQFLSDGKPELAAKVLLGKDASWRDNKGIAVTDLRRYPASDGRDLVLARLQTPALDAVPYRIAQSAPAPGEQLEFTGYGRTKTEWVPKQPHKAVFAIASVEAGEIEVSGGSDASLCLGDSGAPAIRTTANGPELVALNSRSWQQNCIGTTDQQHNGAFATRLDGTGDWIAGVADDIQPIATFDDRRGMVFTNVATTGRTFTWELREVAPQIFLLRDPQTDRCLTRSPAAASSELVFQACAADSSAQRFEFLAVAVKDAVVIRHVESGLLVTAGAQATSAPILGAPSSAANKQWTAATTVLADRVAAVDRFTTAVEVSKAGFPQTAPAVYVVSGEQYVDAISAGASAAKLGGPLLLTRSDVLPDATKAELQRLSPAQVRVVGGTISVTDAVLASIKSAVPAAAVSRIGGIDRFETSRATIRSAFTSAPLLYVVDSMDWATALVAGNEAISSKAPVLAINGAVGGLDQASIDFIRAMGTTEIRAIGGTSKINASVFSGLKSVVSTTTRLDGSDTYDLANKSMARAFPNTSSVAYLVSGLGFPDALGAGVLAGTATSPIFFSPQECVKKATLDALKKLDVKKVVVIGGTASLSDNVAALKPCAS
ncbi:cell wall-binding repeat-containing protein [Leifsonia sp. NPDC058194]|uniref:cell wall-binding repeat-containing protein n=1 Tax=Leifsonia sp. NPDC058194 TaxID=3346374 RepID=UPI0036DEF21B